MYRLVWFVLKLIVTAVLCAWIVAHVDWVAFWSELSACNLWLIGAIFVLLLAGVTISAYKWQQCLMAFDVLYPLASLERWYFVAMFLNHFLPTSIGGDGYRIYKTLNNQRNRSSAVLAVFLERLNGVFALLLMGYLAAMWNCLRRPDKFSTMLVGLGSLGLAVALVVIWGLFRWRRVGKDILSTNWPRALASLAENAECLAGHSVELARIGALSFIFHANRIFIVWLTVVALGTECHLADLTLSVATMNVIGLIPISLGGLGLEDGSFMYLMGHYGLSYETGLSTMLLLRVLLLPISLMGGYFYLVRQKLWPDVNHAIEQSGQDKSSGAAEVEQSAAAVEAT